MWIFSSHMREMNSTIKLSKIKWICKQINNSNRTTIKNKLEAGLYSSYIDYFKDVDLIWQNC